MNVDLPEPDGPQITILSPRLTSRFSLFSAKNLPNHLDTSSTRIMTAPFFAAETAALGGASPTCVVSSAMLPQPLACRSGHPRGACAGSGVIIHFRVPPAICAPASDYSETG